MSVNLFLRTLSEALQAFIPVAVALAWFQRKGELGLSSAIRRGLIASVPLTVVASLLVQYSTRRALHEALLAALTVAIASVFDSMVWRDQARRAADRRERNRVSLMAATTLTAVIIVRQTMEIGSVLDAAAFELRLLSATLGILGAVAAGGCIALAVRWFAGVLGDREAVAATRTFAVVFVAQAVIYAFHEITEARLLPASDLLHAATEPYSAEGVYGVHLSELLALSPVVGAAIAFFRVSERVGDLTRFWSARPAAITGLAIASLAVLGSQGADSAWPRDRQTASPGEIAAIAGRPHLLFRDTSRSSHFGMLSLAPLDSPVARRVSTQLSCERVSFSGGRGLCLHTVPGIFFHYDATVLGDELRPIASIKLEGRPSRTRTSVDGRIGAMTVFVFGDKYAAPFSTRTTLVDMSSGDVIGELEQFGTWRNGARFRSVDFNFWGVTFATDNKTFYASLGTGGSTYLVRGELALRKLTVLRENVECPALSPDDRLLAFKKRVGPGADRWRLAVLDLNSMKERLVSAETRSIDDQVEWLDSGHVLYAVPGGTQSISDVWIAPVDGGGPARLFLPDAESPIVVR